MLNISFLPVIKCNQRYKSYNRYKSREKLHRAEFITYPFILSLDGKSINSHVSISNDDFLTGCDSAKVQASPDKAVYVSSTLCLNINFAYSLGIINCEITYSL